MWEKQRLLFDKQIQGVFRYINEYMRQMKDKGVYDNSTVIITADHGGYGLYERPAVFVKMADTHNDVMQVNSDSVTFKESVCYLWQGCTWTEE